MNMRSTVPLAVLWAPALLACAAHGGHSSQRAAQPTVRGSVSYRERVALPADAVVDVWITDVSPLIMAQVLLAETTVRSEGRQVPISFELRYDAGMIQPDHVYGIKAVIRSAGEMLFASDTAHLVITKGNPTQVNLWLKRVSEGPGATTGLLGTAWRLEDLGGAGVIDNVEVTLEFPEAGKVAGKASCNRFFGTAEVAGGSITLSPLGTTRMACPEAVMNQEGKYLKALHDAERFALEGTALLVYSRGMETPLRFTRKE
ncbi:MAG: YbaY family lipoprotein [Gemmatimonadales bacterium]